MADRNPSGVRRVLGLIVFRFVLLLLILGIGWSGYQVVQAVAERVGDAVRVNQRTAAYIATGTAIAPLFATSTATSTDTATLTASHTPSSTATFTASATDTSIPSATSTPTATFSPTETPTLTATLTAAPTLTPTDVPTQTPLATVISVAAAQLFSTNTPHAQDAIGIATNTSEPSATSVSTATATLSPTASASPTLTATFPPPPTATETARPLPTLLIPADPNLQQAGGTAVPTRVSPVDRHGYDLLNILVLGGDDEVTGDNIVRTDTMIIVSINRTTNTVAMLSLPRDLYVYIPNGTMNRLNVAYSIGESIGWTGGGFGLLRQTILYNLGINVHFYALVNFSGFEKIIDTIGGVDVSVDCAYQGYYPVDDFDPSRPIEENYKLRTLDIGYYTMNGFDALWYARTRRTSDDFDRGRRQQQILRAIWRKARDSGLLAQAPQLWNEMTQLVKTDLGFEDMLGLLPMALSLDASRIDHFNFIRTYHTTPWQTPQGDYVQIPNYDTMLPLLEDFYEPPTESQIELRGARVAVYNGTQNVNWDRVAAERLSWEGYNATAMGAGPATNYADTVLIDRAGQEKGGQADAIARLLNVRPENIRVEPDANRTTDFEVILGGSYNSCTFGVLPPQ